MLTAFTARPFLKAVLGGAVGMAAVLVLAGTVLLTLHTYNDHVLIHAIVKALNDSAAAQQRQAKPPN